MVEAECVLAENESKTTERISSPRLRLIQRLIAEEAVVATDRRPGYRLDMEKVGKIIEDFQNDSRLKHVNEQGEEVDFEVTEGEKEMMDYVSKHSLRWFAWKLTQRGIVDSEVIRLAGLVCRPSTVHTRYDLELGTDYTWRGAVPLIELMIKEYGIVDDSKIVKTPLIRREPSNFGIRLNMIEILYANRIGFERLEQALEENGVELDCNEVNTLILVKQIGHEYGHALTQAKLYSNLLAAEHAYESDSVDGYIRAIDRAYKTEQNQYLNWVFRQSPIPLLGDQNDNQKIRHTSVERIARGMEMIALRECLWSLLVGRGASGEKAGAVALRVAELEVEKHQSDIAEVLRLMEDNGLVIEVLDDALREIDRRYQGRGLQGYSMSLMLGYNFPLSEEEIIKVLRPMDEVYAQT